MTILAERVGGKGCWAMNGKGICDATRVSPTSAGGRERASG